MQDPAPPTDDARFAEVVALFLAVDKALRGLRLYEGQGTLFDRQLDELTAKALAVTAGGEVTVRVTSAGLTFAGRPLSEEQRRQPHLFRLFCDGVRELTFLPGVDRSELIALIRILSRDTRGTDEDLVTRLWSASLPHVRHYAVDSFGPGTAEVGDTDLTLLRTGGERIERGDVGQRRALSADDVRLLQAQNRLGWVKSAVAPRRTERRGTDVLRKRILGDSDYRRFVAIGLRATERAGTRGRGVQASPLVLGQFDAMVAVRRASELGGLFAAIAEASMSGPAGAALLAAVLLPERVVRVGPLLLEEADLGASFLAVLAKHGREGALGLMNTLPAGPAQDRLQAALLREGVDLTPYYAARLRSAVEQEVFDATLALGKVGHPDALAALAGPLKSASPALRAAALVALGERYVPDLRPELGRLLRDPSRENRLLALAALRRSGDSRVGGAVMLAVEDPGFASKDAEEQELFYTALASLQDNRTLGHFRGVLDDVNLLRSRSVVSRQMLCVRALTAVGTPEAKALLQGYRGAWHLPAEVATAIRAALK